jgi:hypothetical protein
MSRKDKLGVSQGEGGSRDGKRNNVVAGRKEA